MLRRLALLACLLAVVLSACGGSSATRRDVIARGNAICTATVRAVRSAGSGATTTGPELDVYLQRVVPLVEKEVRQLRGLPRPARDRGLLNRYLAAIGQAGAQYRALGSAAHRHDSAAVAQALGQLRSNPAPGLARQYGLAACASAVGTSTS